MYLVIVLHGLNIFQVDSPRTTTASINLASLSNTAGSDAKGTAGKGTTSAGIALNAPSYNLLLVYIVCTMILCHRAFV